MVGAVATELAERPGDQDLAHARLGQVELRVRVLAQLLDRVVLDSADPSMGPTINLLDLCDRLEQPGPTSAGPTSTSRSTASQLSSYRVGSDQNGRCATPSRARPARL